jgi:hypothetical protein
MGAELEEGFLVAGDGSVLAQQQALPRRGGGAFSPAPSQLRSGAVLKVPYRPSSASVVKDSVVAQYPARRGVREATPAPGEDDACTHGVGSLDIVGAHTVLSG